MPDRNRLSRLSAADSSGVAAYLCSAQMSQIAPPSETTNPSKPHCLRSKSVNKNALAQSGTPYKELYAPITDATCPSRTAASNAGRYVSYKSRSVGLTSRLCLSGSGPL